MERNKYQPQVVNIPPAIEEEIAKRVEEKGFIYLSEIYQLLGIPDTKVEVKRR